ncbi:MAG: hypothetical protein AAF460_09815 [Pseudomonadota bacterium]
MEYTGFLWLGAYVIGVGYFTLSRNAERKRAAWAPFVGALSLAVVVLAYQHGARWPGLALFAVVMFSAAWGAVSLTQFCTACGATAYARLGFLRHKTCPKCRAAFDGAS